jgi:hypothetical protein
VSIFSTARRSTTSAMPMPTALPSVSAVRSRTTIRWMLGPAPVGPGVVAADDVGIHPQAADVLADVVEHEHVDAAERQPGHRSRASTSSSRSRSQILSRGTASIRDSLA